MPKIAVLNRSRVVPDDGARAMVEAIQIQVTAHWTPVWGIPATLSYVSTGEPDPTDPDLWIVVLLNTSDEAGALGYHDRTKSGRPIGKVFAQTDLAVGASVSVTLSHEVLEMLADPTINLLAAAGKRLWAYEVCDACEDDSFGYLINGVLVSDFVFPNYFCPDFPGPYDYMKVIPTPLAILKNGYMSYFEGGSWQQVSARQGSNAVYRAIPPVGSRRERRARGVERWMDSTAV